MVLKFDSMQKAIQSLSAVLERTNDEEYMSDFDDVTRYALRAGAIQNFEFTYELCWKHMKRWLEYNVGHSNVEGLSRRGLFRLASEYLLIDDVEKWIYYHQSRNLTSHTYNQDTADEVYDAASQFLADAKKLMVALESKNDED